MLLTLDDAGPDTHLGGDALDAPLESRGLVAAAAPRVPLRADDDVIMLACPAHVCLSPSRAVTASCPLSLADRARPQAEHGCLYIVSTNRVITYVLARLLGPRSCGCNPGEAGTVTPLVEPSTAMWTWQLSRFCLCEYSRRYESRRRYSVDYLKNQ